MSEHARFGSREYWQAVAGIAERSPRIYVGVKVEVVAGRKHKGLKGTVTRHQRSHFEADAFRYASGASLDMRILEGRRGFVALVQPEQGPAVWVPARYLCPEGFTVEQLKADHWID